MHIWDISIFKPAEHKGQGRFPPQFFGKITHLSLKLYENTANYNTLPPQILSFQYIAPLDFESFHRACKRSLKIIIILTIGIASTRRGWRIVLSTIVILNGLIVAMASGGRNGLMDGVGHGHVGYCWIACAIHITRIVSDASMRSNRSCVYGLGEVSCPF